MLLSELQARRPHKTPFSASRAGYPLAPGRSTLDRFIRVTRFTTTWRSVPDPIWAAWRQRYCGREGTVKNNTRWCYRPIRAAGRGRRALCLGCGSGSWV